MIILDIGGGIMKFICPECNGYVSATKNSIDKVVICSNCDTSLFLTKPGSEIKVVTFRLGNTSEQEDEESTDEEDYDEEEY